MSLDRDYSNLEAIASASRSAFRVEFYGGKRSKVYSTNDAAHARSLASSDGKVKKVTLIPARPTA